MKKYIVLFLFIFVAIWFLIAKVWVGTEKPPKTYDFPEATITPTPLLTISPSENSSSSATPSAFFEASSSSVRLVAPTITVNLNY